MKIHYTGSEIPLESLLTSLILQNFTLFPSSSLQHTVPRNSTTLFAMHIYNDIRQISVPPSSSGSVSSSTTPATNSLGFDPFGLLSSENFPEIRYWRRKNFSGDDVTEFDDDTEKVGKLGFIEHITGVRFTAEELKSVRKHTYESFAGLLEDGIAPQKWSQASSTATQRVRKDIITKHPEISLCTNNWKVDALITETYGQWTTRRKPQIAESSKHRQQEPKSKSKRKHDGSTEEKEGERKRAKRDSKSHDPIVKNKEKKKHRRRDLTIEDADINSTHADSAIDSTPDHDEDDSPHTDHDDDSAHADPDDVNHSVLNPLHDLHSSLHASANPSPNNSEHPLSARGSPEWQPEHAVAARPKKITLSNPLAKAKSDSKGKGREIPTTADVTKAPVPSNIPSSAAAPSTESGSPTTIPSASTSNTTPSSSKSTPLIALIPITPAPGPPSASNTNTVVNDSAAEPKKKGKPYKPGAPDTAW
ncbi:hypothetical protein DFH07DRAFT_286825 [Mycena maculata]|uniref:Uncharacterized protein n=1 Tax=Mycena maculata TaxID=230809 RepID=A0AAD7HLN6_9AGAR|nr:hypothetical protein DFH07DRAFT_374756 [Mycena maculata]KAJ7722669.1 hypothetical protein DFH07DRAFT_286825 [Mycena maculata]